MKPEYCRDLNHNYMVLQGSEEVGGEEYSVRVTSTNPIPGLLECRVHRLDGRVQFYYEITSRQSLSSIAERKKIGESLIQALLKGLELVFESMRDYLLDTDALVLAEDYIYLDVETEEVFFCYLPLSDQKLTAAFTALSEYILKNLDHQDKEAVLWGYALYSQTTRENYSIKAALQEVHKQMAVPSESEPGQEKAGTDRKRPEVTGQQPENHPPDPVLLPKNQPNTKRYLLIGGAAIVVLGICIALVVTGIIDPVKAAGALFCVSGIVLYLFAAGRRKQMKEQKEAVADELVELLEESDEPVQTGPEQVAQDREEYGETTLLCRDTPEKLPLLESMQPQQHDDIELFQKSTVIGKMSGYADVVINAPAVSRVHAKVERVQTELFLTDLNSTNGTFLNGERMNANECRRIAEGDQVYFADNGYFVRI